MVCSDRIKTFDLEWMFNVNNGFDVVIGNPPYINVELVSSSQKKVYKEHYTTIYKRYDIFGLFFEASLLRYTCDSGKVAFIVPQQIANNLSYKKLRNLMLDNAWIREILYLGDDVFEGPNNDVCVIILSKPSCQNIRLVYALDFANRQTSVISNDYFKQYGNVISFGNNMKGETIFEKIFTKDRKKIKDDFTVFQGIVTGNNDAFIPTAQQITEAKIEQDLLHTVLLGRDFEKWTIRNTGRKIIYATGNTDLSLAPNTKKWLHNFKSQLMKRRECKNGTIPWHSLQWPRVQKDLDCTSKIIIQRTRNPRLSTRIVASIEDEGHYGMESIIFLIRKTPNAPIYFLLAILNSKLINYLYATKFLNVAIKAEYLKDTPIPIVSEQDENDLSDLARRVLAAKKADPSVDTLALESEIDSIVYRLYGLTTEEIAIVEDLFKKK